MPPAPQHSPALGFIGSHNKSPVRVLHSARARAEGIIWLLAFFVGSHWLTRCSVLPPAAGLFFGFFLQPPFGQLPQLSGKFFQPELKHWMQVGVVLSVFVHRLCEYRGLPERCRDLDNRQSAHPLSGLCLAPDGAGANRSKSAPLTKPTKPRDHNCDTVSFFPRACNPGGQPPAPLPDCIIQPFGVVYNPLLFYSPVYGMWYNGFNHFRLW